MDSTKDDKAAVGEISPIDGVGVSTSTISKPGHGAPQPTPREEETVGNNSEENGAGWFAFLRTRNFYIILALGYFRGS